MPTETFTNEKGQLESRETKTSEDVASAQDKSRMQSGEGLGKLQKTSKRAMPKQSDYPDMGSYMKAMREYRQAEDESGDSAVVRRGMEKLGQK